jgi:hypothetical protein
VALRSRHALANPPAAARRGAPLPRDRPRREGLAGSVDARLAARTGGAPDAAHGRRLVGLVGWQADKAELATSEGGSAVKTADPLVDHLLAALESRESPSIYAVSGHAFRALTVHAGCGRVTLATGTDQEQPGWWAASLADLKDVLTAHAPELVYGHVKRAWDVGPAVNSVSSVRTADWPKREPEGPYGSGGTLEAFDDLMAPDAFGVQLLGAGYRSRIPPVDDWTVTPLRDASIVEHVSPALWFQTPFGEVGYRGVVAVPDVLARAREDLAPLIYRPGSLAPFGFTTLLPHPE